MIDFVKFMGNPPTVKAVTPIEAKCVYCGKEFYYTTFERFYSKKPTRANDLPDLALPFEEVDKRYIEIHKVNCPHCYEELYIDKENRKK
jgi:hypothetical protein